MDGRKFFNKNLCMPSWPDVFRFVHFLILLLVSRSETIRTLKQYAQTAGFVGFTVRVVVWTPSFLLTPGRVSISKVIQKTKNKQ